MHVVGFTQSCIRMFCQRLRLPQHLYEEHQASWGYVEDLYGNPPRPASYYAALNYPLTGPPDVRLLLPGCMETRTKTP